MDVFRELRKSRTSRWIAQPSSMPVSNQGQVSRMKGNIGAPMVSTYGRSLPFILAAIES